MTTLSPTRPEVLSTTSPMWECVVGLRLALASGNDSRDLLAEGIVLLPAILRHATVLPHFLLPPPEQAHPSFADELAQVAKLSPAVVTTELGYAFGSTFGWQEPEEVLPAQLRWIGRSPERALERLVAELERYWSLKLAERWARREELVREDALRVGGAVSADLGLVGALDRSYRAEDGAVWATNLPGAPRKLCPSRLVLVASVLPRGALTIDCGAPGIAWEGRPPMLSYLVRGAAEPRRRPPTDELVALVGARRAAILRALVTPRTTSDLALRLGVTAGAISQQLAHLQSAGLLVRTREHPYVHYRLSARGEQLLAVFEAR